MKRNSKIALFATGIMALSMVSCTKKFEDINNNPNSPTDVPSTNVLANAVQNVGANLYDAWADMNEPETYAGHLAKIQYIDEARYSFRTGTVENDWTYDYRILHDLQGIIDRSTAQETNMKATAMTLQAFVLQIVTDTWRDVPWTQAIQGAQGYISPTYDTQEQLYDTLQARLQVAADLFKEGAADELGTGDLLYGGDVAKWQKFCNSLRLRVAIRLSNVAAAKAKPVIESIFADPTSYPVFESNDDNAFIMWPGSDPYFEPWYDDYQGRDDHAVSDVLINQLNTTSDPRLAVYAKKNDAGIYKGAPIGPAGDLTSIAQYSRIGVRFRETPAGFTPLQRYAEVLFIEAEAAAKGWNVPLSAAAAYDAGVTASMAENGLTTTAANAFLVLNPYKTEADIHMQKWVALFKDGHEAWAEERRTDIPLLPAAPGSSYTGHTRPPFRYPYTTKENTLNGANLAPFLAKVKQNFWGQQMYWDTRTNVQ